MNPAACARRVGGVGPTFGRMTSRSLYEVLGVPDNSSREDIKAAYKRLVRTVHPDVGGNAALFEFVQAAYETLADPARRAAYDRSQSGGAPPPRPSQPPRSAAAPPTPPPAPSRTGRAVFALLGAGVVIAVGIALASSGGPDPAVAQPSAGDGLVEPATEKPAVPKPAIAEPSPVAALVVETVAPIEPAPTGPSYVDVQIAQVRAEFACTSALSRLPLDLNDPQLEPALRAAADAALSASLKDAKWLPLRVLTRTALGSYIATGDAGDQTEAVDEFSDAMFEIDQMCQASS